LSGVKILISFYLCYRKLVANPISLSHTFFRSPPADPLVQNTGRNPERLLNKTVTGFTIHMAAKIASHTLRLLLKLQFEIDVQTFQSVTSY